MAEIKGIPEHYEIQLIDPETNEKFLFDRQKKEIQPLQVNSKRKSASSHRKTITADPAVTDKSDKIHELL